MQNNNRNNSKTSGKSNNYSNRRHYNSYNNKNNRSKNKRRHNNRRKSSISRDKYVQKAVESKDESIFVSDVEFKDLNITDKIKERVERQGFNKLTKIQAQAIPHILDQKDVLAISETGSGKTGAFLIPLIDKIVRHRDQRCLVITPTRELALQIQVEFKKFTKDLGVNSALITGGSSMRKQIATVRQNPQFIAATPGRLKDLFQRKLIPLHTFNNIVLDEVDRMLDMGFIRDIEYFISKLPSQKQSLFFSATLNDKAERIANSFLTNPVKIHNKSSIKTENIEQDIVRVGPQQHKLHILNDLLHKDEFKKVLIFSRTRRGADRLSRDLNSRGFNADAIHGNKSQNRRTAIISDFKDNSISILVATDVASRGLDIPNITHVINYDEPATYDDYIHRIGRTGRIGKKGMALTFVN